MFKLKIRYFIVLASAIVLLLSQNALAATAMDSIGTGSSGSYSHGKPKVEGSKSKTPSHHISGSKKHYKSEGSRSKSYSHHKKGHDYSKGSSHKGHVGHRGHSKCPFTHLLRFKNKLGLTESQIAEIKRLRFEYGKQSIRNKAEHKIAHMEFDRNIHAEKVDERAILSAAEKIAATKTQKIMNMAKAKIALLNLLTDEQRKKAHAMHSAHSHH